MGGGRGGGGLQHEGAKSETWLYWPPRQCLQVRCQMMGRGGGRGGGGGEGEWVL